MARLRSLAAAGLLLLSTASAQFLLNFPPSLEGERVALGQQTTGACGGGVPDLPNNAAVDFHIDGDVVALDIKQIEGNILFGATIDAHANGGWQQLYPVVQVQGQGTYCQKGVKAPKEWLGKMGIVGIVLKKGEEQRYQVGSRHIFNPGISRSVTNGIPRSAPPSTSSRASTRPSAPAAPTAPASTPASRTTCSSRAWSTSTPSTPPPAPPAPRPPRAPRHSAGWALPPLPPCCWPAVRSFEGLCDGRKTPGHGSLRIIM